MKKLFLMCSALVVFVGFFSVGVVLADEQKKESVPPQKQVEQTAQEAAPAVPAPILKKVEIRKLPQVIPQSSQGPVQSK